MREVIFVKCTIVKKFFINCSTYSNILVEAIELSNIWLKKLLSYNFLNWTLSMEIIFVLIKTVSQRDVISSDWYVMLFCICSVVFWWYFCSYSVLLKCFWKTLIVCPVNVKYIQIEIILNCRPNNISQNCFFFFLL